MANTIATILGIPQTGNAPVQTGAVAGAGVRLPSWIDSRYLMATTLVQIDPVATIPANSQGIIGADAERWMLVVCAGAILTSPLRLSLSSSPAAPPFATITAGQSIAIQLATYGPLACYQWYVNGTAGDTYQTYQISHS